MKSFRFWSIGRLEKRILEIQSILGSEERRKNMASGIAMPLFEGRLESADRPLRAELEELKLKRQFKHDNRLLLANVFAMAVSLAIAFTVPPWEQSLKQNEAERAAVQSLYQTVVANGDIFVENFNSVRMAMATTTTMFPPESQVEFPVDENVHKLLQRGLGIVQYRFLLYYLGQTKLMNEEIELVRNEMVAKGPTPAAQLGSVRNFQATLQTLEGGDWKSAKFNYVYDTGCIEHLLSKTFSFIDIAKRDQKVTCESDSLNRIFYLYGFIPDETPAWLLPELTAALNEREPGLGDRLILPWADQGLR